MGASLGTFGSQGYRVCSFAGCRGCRHTVFCLDNFSREVLVLLLKYPESPADPSLPFHGLRVLLALTPPSPVKTTLNVTPIFGKKGEYYDAANEADGEEERCLMCAELDLGTEGLDCNDPGVLLGTLPLARGYWRSSNATTTIRQCLYDEACEGGSVIQESNDYCAVGYEGPCERSFAFFSFLFGGGLVVVMVDVRDRW